MQDNRFFLLKTKKESIKNLLSYLGLFVASATVIVFSALFFTDVSFSFAGTVGFSLSFFLLFFSSYIMYISLFETGRAQGEREEEYRELCQKRLSLFEKFRAYGSQKTLAAFCKDLSVRETRARREDLLHMHFLTEEEASLLESKPKDTLTRAERRAKRALSRQRAVCVTPRALLAERPISPTHIPLASSPLAMKRRRMVGFLLPLFFFAAISVSIACDVLLSPSAETVIGYLLKLFTLLQSGVKGFRAGYFHITMDKTDYMKEQCALLEEYFKSLQKEASEEAFCA